MCSTTSLSVPPSSRTSRTAAISGFSSFSTSPFGSCHLLLLPTATITTSIRSLSRRNTTPPADTCSLTGSLAEAGLSDPEPAALRGGMLSRLHIAAARGTLFQERAPFRFASFVPAYSPWRQDNPLPDRHRRR